MGSRRHKPARLGVAAGGGVLLDRVRRLLGTPSRDRRHLSPRLVGAVAAGVVVGLVICLHLGACASDAAGRHPTGARETMPNTGMAETKATQDDPGAATLANAIADRFAGMMRQRGFWFISDAQFEELHQEIRDFAARYPAPQMSGAERDALLAAVEQYVPDHFVNRGSGSPDDAERAYLEFRDQVNTFKWRVWLALTRKAFTPEDLARRAAQATWLRECLARVPVRPGDFDSARLTPEGLRDWAKARVERELADPLSLIYAPMTDKEFEAFQKTTNFHARNGPAVFVTDLDGRALSVRVPSHPDEQKRYGEAFDVQLPFEDEVVQIWGGIGAHLAFASNAEFCGRYGSIGGSNVYDVIGCVQRTIPVDDQGKGLDGPAVARWAEEHGHADLVYDDGTGTVTGLRGARFAELKTADWFDVDRVTDAELRQLVTEQGLQSVSVVRLPPMNGRRLPRPRFFIVVATAEKRLAVVELRAREFGQVELWSRPRPASATAPRAVVPYPATDLDTPWVPATRAAETRPTAQPAPPQPKLVPWSAAVDGVQCRLRADKGLPGEPPPLYADVRNTGQRLLRLSRGEQFCELEVDGIWYRWIGTVYYESKDDGFGPGRWCCDVHISLPGSWGTLDSGAALAERLTPGEHAVRVAFTARPSNSQEGGPVRAISDTVRINVPASEPGRPPLQPRGTPLRWWDRAWGDVTLRSNPNRAQVLRALADYLRAHASENLPDCRVTADDEQITIAWRAVYTSDGPTPGTEGAVVRLRLVDDIGPTDRPGTADCAPWYVFLGQVRLPTVKACLNVDVAYANWVEGQRLQSFVSPTFRWLQAANSAPSTQPLPAREPR
jgi:hypothetical protein